MNKELKNLKEFASEVKRRIRNVGRSMYINISEIDELIIKHNIQYVGEEDGKMLDL